MHEEGPLSEEQLALWYVQRASPHTEAFNVGIAARVFSRVDTSLLRDCLHALTDRHGSLRTTYRANPEGDPYQRVRQRTATDMATVDARGWSDQELGERVHEAHGEPFDLEGGPPLRTRLFTRSDDEHVLLVTAHHIAVDGWSMWQLLDELRTLYGAGSPVDVDTLSETPSDYLDYVAWQRDMLASDAGRRHGAYWRKQLAGAPRMLELPTDRPRPSVRSMEGATHPLVAPPELTARLKELARSEGVTLYTVLLSAYFVLLHRHARQQDIVVGSIMAGRPRRTFADTLGCFVNTVPIRATVASDLPFRKLVGSVRASLRGGAAHQQLPFRLITREIGVPGDPGVPPLCQALFVFQKPQRFAEAALAHPLLDPDDGRRLDFGGLEVGGFPLEQQQGQVDLALELMEVGDGELAGWLKYDTALFERSTVATTGERLMRLLRSIADDPDAPVSDLRMLSDDELARLAIRAEPPRIRSVEAWTPGAATIHGAFVRRARRNPGRTAVSRGDRSMTYGELERRSRNLAGRLRDEGVEPGSVVALCVDRSPELVVGMLGILRAGAAYLPLDRTHPSRRLEFMLEDAGAVAVVVHGAAADSIGPDGRPMVDLADAPESEPLPVDLEGIEEDAEASAYVMYTSGSTGRPKGVEVTHGNVLSLFRASHPYFTFDGEDVWTLFHSAAFDFSVWEIFGALLFGGRLVVVPFEVSRDPEAFHALLREEGVTVLNQTPSAFLPLIEADRRSDPIRSLRHVILGGEALEPASLRSWVDRYGDRSPHLVNMYGITEITVHVTYRRITAEDVRPGTGSVIGRPLPHLHVYVLGPGMEPVPRGTTGELYVGGEGVSRGYVARPELTAERFVPDPFSEDTGARLYRTGDLARVRENGELEFQGRVDDQVKIRGFRIELGEIDSVIAGHPRVHACATAVRERVPGDRRLVAYVVADGSPGTLREQLEERARSRLPAYMVPTAVVFLQELPLTANGKLDRDALSSPDIGAVADRGAGTPPRTELDEALVKIWEELLGVDDVGIHDNFFELGGHSLLVTRMVERVRTELDVRVSIAPFFRSPTVAELADRIETLSLSPGDPRTGDDPEEEREEFVL